MTYVVLFICHFSRSDWFQAPEAHHAPGVGLVGALFDAVADGVAVLVDLAHAAGAAVHLQAGVCHQHHQINKL